MRKLARVHKGKTKYMTNYTVNEDILKAGLKIHKGKTKYQDKLFIQ